MSDVKREMTHLVHGTCYMTVQTMELDAKNDDITKTYVELPDGEIIVVTRSLLTRKYRKDDL